MELMGIPHRLILGERGLDNGMIEYKNRRTGDGEDIPLDDVIVAFKQKLS
jgi:prolyl-tRNA synthetase